MKKVLVLLLTLTVSIILCVACNSTPLQDDELPKNTESSPVISINLNNFTMDLTNARQIGITTYANLNSVKNQNSIVQMNRVIKTSNQNNNDSTRNDDDIVLIKVDENGNIDEIEFFDEETGNQTSKTIDDYQLEIYKMSVFGEFTAISYISSYWRETQPDAEKWYYNDIVIFNRLKTELDDTYSYQNNDVIKSYLVHNTSGKIYPTDQITGTNGRFHTSQNYDNSIVNASTRIYDGFLRVCQHDCDNHSVKYGNEVSCTSHDKIWYDITINENDELELIDLLPNKDFTIKHAVKDIYGWVYVANSGINDVNVNKKTIYYIGDGYMDGVNNTYKLASNGKVYVKSSNIIPNTLYSGYANVMINGQQTSVSRNDSFDSIRGDNGFMINGVYYYNGSLASGNGGYTIGVDCVDKRVVRMSYAGLPTNTDLIYGNLTFLESLYNIENFYSTEYRVWSGYNKNTGKWELYYIRISEYEYNETTMLDVLECELLLDNFIPASSNKYRYAKATSQGTIIYSIIIDENGKPKINEYSSSIYENIMITIQPIN